MFAEEFENDTNAEAAASTEAGPSKPDFSALFRFRPLTDPDFRSHQSYAPPPSPAHNWDVPLTPNGDKYIYTLTFSGIPEQNKTMVMRLKLQKFLDRYTQPQINTWSIELITTVSSVKRRTYEKSNFYEYEIVRDKKKLVITEADFRKMNPSDIYSIIIKLAPRVERCKDSREAFVAAKCFLHQLLEEFSFGDGELYKFVENHPEDQYRDLVDVSLPDARSQWKKVATFDPMLGLVYSDKSRKGTKLFFRAHQIRRARSVMLESYVAAMKKTSHSDPEAKKELLLRMEWMLKVSKLWSYSWKQSILEEQ